MKTLEARRHSLTKKAAARGQGTHLSREGVRLARLLGDALPPFDYVLTGPGPRHTETSIAMGYAVDDIADRPSDRCTRIRIRRIGEERRPQAGASDRADRTACRSRSYTEASNVSIACSMTPTMRFGGLSGLQS